MRMRTAAVNRTCLTGGNHRNPPECSHSARSHHQSDCGVPCNINDSHCLTRLSTGIRHHALRINRTHCLRFPCIRRQSLRDLSVHPGIPGHRIGSAATFRGEGYEAVAHRLTRGVHHQCGHHKCLGILTMGQAETDYGQHTYHRHGKKSIPKHPSGLFPQHLAIRFLNVDGASEGGPAPSSAPRDLS